VEWAGKSTPRFELADFVREVGLFLMMVFIAGLLLVAELLFLNRLGTLESQAGMAAAPVAPQSGVVESPPIEPQPDPPAVIDGPDGGGEDAGTDAAETAQVAEANEAEAQAAEDAVLKARLDEMCRFDDALGEIPDVAGLVRNAPFVGSESADIVMIEFFDPNCPHCKTLHENTGQIMAQVGDRARWHYRPYPIWPYSYTQVEALYLAEDQGMFDQMLDAQMARQKRGGLSIEELADIAEDIGMDEDEFRSGLNGGKYRSRVNRERAQISRLGIRGVPKLNLDGKFVQSRSVNPACIDHLVEKVEMGG
jgi:protein-disulfide isomerase